MKKNALLLFCFALLFFNACKKSDQSEVETKLTTGLWHEIEYWTDDDLDGTFEQHTESCITDNTWQFQSNGDLVVDEGGETCDPGIPPFAVTAQWELLNNDTQIKITFEFDPQDPTGLAIDALSDTELRAHTIYFDDPNAPSPEKFVFHR